jgi:hypothetical protein
MLLAAALEMPADKRPALLDAMCIGDPALRQRLETLLAAHQEADELPPSDAPAVVATIKLDLAEAEDEVVGKTIGRSKVLEKVGEGGCGVVYMSDQEEPVHRRVALKVIKLGEALPRHLLECSTIEIRPLAIWVYAKSQERGRARLDATCLLLLAVA